MRTLLKISVLFSVAVVLNACCPPGGTDRSFTVNEYPVAVDYYSHGEPVQANLVPKTETYVQLINADNQFAHPLKVEYDNQYANRVFYFFGSEWKTEDIRYVNVKLSSYEFQYVDFAAVEKSSFVREPQKMTGYGRVELTFLKRVECAIHAVTELILPRANAFSCMTSENSRISYREGTLFRVDLD